MILADASVWVDHFRSAHPKMQRLLGAGRIVMHPFVTAEMALGSIRDRARTLLYFDLLPQCQMAQLVEVRQLIEARALYAKGVGLVDANLLASCLLTPGTQLWTRDAALIEVAKDLGVLVFLP